MAWNENRKQHTKEKILKSAAELFLKQGLEGVTIDAVMQAAALTHGAFYHHFASKIALYEQAIHYALMHYSDFFNTVKTKQSLVDFMKKYLSTEYCETNQLHCPLVYLSTDILRDPAHESIHKNLYKQVFDLFVTRIQHIVSKELVAVKIISMLVGTVTLALAIDNNKQRQLILSAGLEQVMQLLHASVD